MQKGFYISVSNGLVDDKHRIAMGESIWLYMLLLDKITSVSEAGIGKVLGGKPLKHSDILQFYPLLPRITYTRYLAILKASGYITTKRTPYGLVINVLKAKKIFKQRDASKTIQPDVSNPIHPLRSIKNDTSLSKYDTSNKTRQLNKTVDKTYGENEISKLYYEAIKVLNLPVLNHNNVKIKIKAMASEDEPIKIIRYLEFVRDKYTSVKFEFMPDLNEAMDIYRKRKAIENNIKREADRQNNNVEVIS